jgi:hypothetical protein
LNFFSSAPYQCQAVCMHPLPTRSRSRRRLVFGKLPTHCT